MPTTLTQADLPGLERVHQGKVRDVYALDGDRLLIVASDRLSAYDVVLPDPIPGKGEILTRLSNFWFRHTAELAPNHLLDVPLEEVLPQGVDAGLYRHRSVVSRRLQPLPVEAIVRGYLIGSGWREYQASGRLCGIDLPQGLAQAAALPQPLFTPSTKAAQGDHDENISFAQMCSKVGRELAERVRDTSIAIYRHAATHARARGIIIADTKFEFGLDADGALYVIDEMLTPDSSRFWPVAGYRTGISPPSYDKQYVRDYLDTLDWDKRAPGPALPAAVIDATVAKYREALATLTRADRN